jgi:hypothetical protein
MLHDPNCGEKFQNFLYRYQMCLHEDGYLFQLDAPTEVCSLGGQEQW